MKDLSVFENWLDEILGSEFLYSGPYQQSSPAAKKRKDLAPSQPVSSWKEPAATGKTVSGERLGIPKTQATPELSQGLIPIDEAIDGYDSSPTPAGLAAGPQASKDLLS